VRPNGSRVLDRHFVVFEVDAMAARVCRSPRLFGISDLHRVDEMVIRANRHQDRGFVVDGLVDQGRNCLVSPRGLQLAEPGAQVLNLVRVDDTNAELEHAVMIAAGTACDAHPVSSLDAPLIAPSRVQRHSCRYECVEPGPSTSFGRDEPPRV
jgi:hypothetical protein